MENLQFDYPIDVVIPWVDDQDSIWISEREKYMDEYTECKTKLSHYFRDWDTLRYVFRGIEQNMPWVRCIHFITCGHLPDWLNKNHPKLKIHFHKDFFSKESILPVFSCNPIEMNLRNIPDLSEHFVYFNDDMLVVKPITQERFFQQNLPVDFLVLDIPRGGWLYDTFRVKESFSYICRNSIGLLNDKISLKKLQKLNPTLFFHPSYSQLDRVKNFLFSSLGVYKWFKLNHFPQPLLLSNLKKCYELFKYQMDNTSKNRFRTYQDLNQYLYRYYALMNGQFIPKYFDDSFCLVLASEKRYKKERKVLFSKTLVCLNDTPFLKEAEYPSLKKQLQKDLNEIFPTKSEYEL